jgi:lipoate-protein ligase A
MRIERLSGFADELLAGVPESFDKPFAVVHELAATTLILGSSQRSDEVVDQYALEVRNIQVARRRSGGGAVLISPGRSIWIDVLIPRADVRWSDDVVEAAFWLGDIWAGAFGDLGVKAEVHRVGLEKNRWGRIVCFAAMGPGEVAIDGRKVVGISQRRTRSGARFQCLVHEQWDPQALLEVLNLSALERMDALAQLGSVAAGAGVSLLDLERAVLDRLST